MANLLEHHATHVKQHEAEQREHERLVRFPRRERFELLALHVDDPFELMIEPAA